jgi:hypothetical protein
MNAFDNPNVETNQQIKSPLPDHVLTAVCDAMGWADTEHNHELAYQPALAAITAWAGECEITTFDTQS